MPCPSCSAPAIGESPIVGAVLRTYEQNVRDHGSGVPPTLAVLTLWDDYLYRGLFFLKAIDTRRPRETEESVLDRSVATIDGSKGVGWRRHIEEFYRAILRARRGPPGTRRADRPERKK